MKSFQLNINSFKLGSGKNLEFQNSGEIYYTGAKKLVNLIPRNNNILTRRPGSTYLNTLNGTYTQSIKLITVDFDNETLLLEFTKGKVRFYIDNELVRHDGQPYEIKSPYETKEEIDSINYTQDSTSNSILLFSINFIPHILSLSRKNNLNKFSLRPMSFIDGPYEDINTTNTTLKPDKTTGHIVNIIASSDIFSYRDMGLHLRIYDEKAKIWGWGIITRIVKACHIQVDIKKELGSINATKYWRIGVFNNFRGYPQVGKIFNSRLYVANTVEKNSQVWASCYNDYSNFAPTTNSDEFNLVSNLPDTVVYSSSITFVFSEVKSILWLEVTFQYVVIGSKEGIFAIMPLDTTKNLSPFNFTVQKITSSSTLKLVASNNYHIFFPNHINNLSALEFTSDSVIPNVVNNVLPAVGNLKKVITNIVISYTYENIVTILFNTGEISFVILNTINNKYIYSFSEVKLGGKLTKVKAISGNSQYLYLLVERLIDELYVTTLEYINWQDLNLTLDNQVGLQSIQYIDCKIKSEHGISTNFITINNNDPTAVIADYSYIGEITSKSGKVDLTIPASSTIIGYNYNSYYESLNLNTIPIMNNGWATYKKLKSLTVGVVNSLGSTLKVNSTILIKDMICLDLIDINNNFFTGYKSYKLNFSYYNNLSISIIQTTPFPLNINLIIIEVLYS